VRQSERVAYRRLDAHFSGLGYSEAVRKTVADDFQQLRRVFFCGNVWHYVFSFSIATIKAWSTAGMV
jgi:hypothetical protein